MIKISNSFDELMNNNKPYMSFTSSRKSYEKWYQKLFINKENCVKYFVQHDNGKFEYRED